MATPMIAKELQATLRKAYEEARRMRHEFVTLEHLLLALCDDPKAAKALDACRANRHKLRKSLAEWLENSLEAVPDEDGDELQPHQTIAVERVLQQGAPLPAGRVRPMGGARWFLDAEAASRLDLSE